MFCTSFVVCFSAVVVRGICFFPLCVGTLVSVNVTLTKGQHKGQRGIKLSSYEALYDIYNKQIHYTHNLYQ